MPNLGFSELMIIFLIVLMLFGARRLPEIGSGLGKAIRSFKDALSTPEGKGDNDHNERDAKS